MYTAFAGVAALVAGFVGVVAVFATVAGTAWSRVRDIGAESLIRNWTSPLGVTLSAALLAVLAALLLVAGYERTAWWTFETSALLVVSAGLRLVWLLKGLLEAQRRIDAAAAKKKPTLQELGLPAASESRSAAG